MQDPSITKTITHGMNNIPNRWNDTLDKVDGDIVKALTLWIPNGWLGPGPGPTTRCWTGKNRLPHSKYYSNQFREFLIWYLNHDTSDTSDKFLFFTHSYKGSAYMKELIKDFRIAFPNTINMIRIHLMKKNNDPETETPKNKVSPQKKIKDPNPEDMCSLKDAISELWCATNDTETKNKVAPQKKIKEEQKQDDDDEDTCNHLYNWDSLTYSHSKYDRKDDDSSTEESYSDSDTDPEDRYPMKYGSRNCHGDKCRRYGLRNCIACGT